MYIIYLYTTATQFQKKTIYPPLILVFYIELGTLCCLKCSCVGNLGQPPPDAGGFCVPPLVNERYIIQHSYNCTISVCNQTHIEILKQKKQKTYRNQTVKTLFPPIVFCCNWTKILSFGNLGQPKVRFGSFSMLGSRGPANSGCS